MRYRPADDPIAASASNSQPPPSTRLPQHDDLFFHEKLKEMVYALIQRISVCLDDQIGVLGRFVGGRDAGHVGDFTGPGPSVKAFRVPFLAGFNPAFDIAFKIRDFPGRTGRLPSRNPHRPVRARLTHTVPQNYGFTAQTSRTRSFKNKFRYPFLFRVHVLGFQRTRRVSHQQFHNSGTALPSSGSPRVGFAVLISTMTVLRLPNAIPPHFVSFAWRYHRPHHLFVSPARPREAGPAQARMFPILSLATRRPSLFPWSTSGLPGSWGVLPYLCPAQGDGGRGMGDGDGGRSLHLHI
jgi:hypothetical protein